MSTSTGPATVNGVQQPQAVPQGAAQSAQPDNGQQPTEQQAAPAAQQQQAQPEPGSVPYGRFKEVVEARKTAEETLAAVVDSIVAALPEDMRELVPNLPPAEKVKWINAATEKGFFIRSAAPATPDSPGSQRPGGKPTQDLNGLNPVQMMAQGYGQ